MRFSKSTVGITTATLLSLGILVGSGVAHASTTAITSSVVSFEVGQTTPAFSLAWAPTWTPGQANYSLGSLNFYPTLPNGSTWMRASGVETTCSASYPGGLLANCGIDSLTVGGTVIAATANKSNGASNLQIVLTNPVAVTPGTEIIINFKEGLLTTPTDPQIGRALFRVTALNNALNPSANVNVAIVTAPSPSPTESPSGSGSTPTVGSDDTLATTGSKNTQLFEYSTAFAISLLILGGAMVAARRMQRK